MSRGKRNLVLCGVSILLVLSLGSMVNPPDTGAQSTKPDFLLRCAGTMPVGHFMTRTLEYYAKIIQERSKGRIKMEIYPVNQLFSDKDLPKALPSGAVDMGQVNMAMWTGLVPSLGVQELPFFYKDRDHFFRAMISPGVRKVLDKDFESKGVKILYWMD